MRSLNVDFSDPYSTPDSNVLKLRYVYDVLDRVTTQTNPDGTSTTNTYGLWEVSSYDENGNRIDRVFNADGKIITIREYNNGEVYNTTYTYDTLGNLLSITDNEGNNWNYTYDSLGRQTSLDDPDVGLLNYSYDANGNLIGQISGSGNLVSGDGYYREYNELGQLERIRKGDNESGEIFEEYTYDHEGIRVKTYNYEKNETVYTPFKEMMVIVNSSGTFNYTYVYADDVLVAKINPDGSKWYYHPDHLGSTSLITDENGSVVEDTVYYPYGLTLDGGTSEVKLYEGKELDDTGMYYYNARYYIPEFRLFVQPDTMLPDVYDPQQLNRYMFERGNPYVYTDPSGNAIFPYHAIGTSLALFSLGDLKGGFKSLVGAVEPDFNMEESYYQEEFDLEYKDFHLDPEMTSEEAKEILRDQAERYVETGDTRYLHPMGDEIHTELPPGGGKDASQEDIEIHKKGDRSWEAFKKTFINTQAYVKAARNSAEKEVEDEEEK